MLCGDLAVMQAPSLDSLSFDPFSLFQDGLSPSEVDIGRVPIIDALVITVVVVVIHEGFNAGLKISGEEVVFQQDSVLQGLVRTVQSCPGFGDDKVRPRHGSCPCPPANQPDHRRCSWHRCQITAGVCVVPLA